MATKKKPSPAACSPALKAVAITNSDSDQAVIVKAFSNQSSAPGDIKVRNAYDDTDVTIPNVQVGQRIDLYVSRIYTTGSTVTSNIIGYVDPDS